MCGGWGSSHKSCQGAHYGQLLVMTAHNHQWRLSLESLYSINHHNLGHDTWGVVLSWWSLAAAVVWLLASVVGKLMSTLLSWH